MKRSLQLLPILAALFAATVAAQLTADRPTPSNGPPGASVPTTAPDGRKDNPTELKWDAVIKDLAPKTGETSAVFVFNVSNVSMRAVSILALHSSCGCTIAELPPLPDKPFVLAPGASAAIRVKMDLSGKSGTVQKAVTVESSVGFSSLQVRAQVPPVALADVSAMSNRAANAQLAAMDRQAIFRGDCARCHVEKGVGKMGKELYAADCGICHNSPHRAEMVPDLRAPRGPRDIAFWRTWIIEGKAGTMMPAFGAEHGGPLTAAQVDSLVAYLYENFPRDAVALPPAPAAPVERKQ